MTAKYRAFTDTLRELRNGQTLDDLSERLNELVRDVRATGKSGELTLSIKVAPASKGDTDTLMLNDTIKVKAPDLDRASTLFFATVENNLSRQHPRQVAMDLGLVDKTTGEVVNTDAKVAQ